MYFHVRNIHKDNTYICVWKKSSCICIVNDIVHCIYLCVFLCRSQYLTRWQCGQIKVVLWFKVLTFLFLDTIANKTTQRLIFCR